MQQQQQQERSWREHIGSLFASRSFVARQHRGAGEGAGLVKVVNIFLPWIHFSIEALFLVEYYVYLFTAGMKTR